MRLRLMTPEKEVVADMEVDSVVVPAYKGQLEILPGHVPLVTTLNPGILAYRPTGEKDPRWVALSWGYCEVSPTGLTILAETAETKEEVDRERAEAAKKKAEEALAQKPSGDELLRQQRKLQKARARLSLFEG